MDLKDATLMFLSESAAYPAVASIAQNAYDRLVEGEEIDYRVLSDLIGEASGKGVLRELHRKYSPTAFDAIIMPICAEVDRQKPVPPRRRTAPQEDAIDPLTAPLGTF